MTRLLCKTLVLATAFASPALAVTLTVGTATGAPGATVTVPVSADLVSGLLALELTLTTDAARLTVTNVQVGTLTSGFASSFGSSAGVTRIAMASGTPASGSGTVAVLTVAIAAGAPAGSVPVALTAASLNDQPVGVTGGAVVISGTPTPCAPSSTTLCLRGNRFRAEGTYSLQDGQSGALRFTPLTDESGYFVFDRPSDVQAIVKVLDACGFNNRLWLFVGALTDQEVRLTVTDTRTGAVKTVTNPLKTSFLPVQDTSAFATCP